MPTKTKLHQHIRRHLKRLKLKPRHRRILGKRLNFAQFVLSIIVISYSFSQLLSTSYLYANSVKTSSLSPARVIADKPQAQVAAATINPNLVEYGQASWYALGLRSPDALTCASRTYPRGTYLLITDRYNNATIVCLVNDYGPEAWTQRSIDLSRGTFSRIAPLWQGTISVSIQRVDGPHVELIQQLINLYGPVL